jgi:hypothetical protein
MRDPDIQFRHWTPIFPPTLSPTAHCAKQGNQNMSQNMMRARILAQGVTVALMVGSSGAVVLPSMLGGSAK